MLQAAGNGGETTAAGVETGVTLDFVLDTAANTNTINAQVAGPTSQGGLELEQVGAIAGGVGAGGALGGGATFMLGLLYSTCADAPKEERLVFMSGLTATALPVAPAAAGLLGVAFLNSFAGGVSTVRYHAADAASGVRYRMPRATRRRSTCTARRRAGTAQESGARSRCASCPR